MRMVPYCITLSSERCGTCHPNDCTDDLTHVRAMFGVSDCYCLKLLGEDVAPFKMSRRWYVITVVRYNCFLVSMMTDVCFRFHWKGGTCSDIGWMQNEWLHPAIDERWVTWNTPWLPLYISSWVCSLQIAYYFSLMFILRSCFFLRNLPRQTHSSFDTTTIAMVSASWHQ